MDNNNWRPTQGGEPPMESVEWRTTLQPDSRQRIVNKIMETLKRHLPFSGSEGLLELKKIAVRFEEKIYTAATSQSDYLRKISLKMLTMESKSSQNPMPNAMQSTSGNNGNNPPDLASQSMQPQVNNQGQPHSIPVPTNQSLGLSHNHITASGHGATGYTNGLPNPNPNIVLQHTMPNVVGQNSNLQNIQNISGVPTSGNSMGQGGLPSNIFAANTQRQNPVRQQQQQGVPQQQQQQQQPQNSQQYLYQQQQLQQQMMKQKLQQGNIPHSMMQSHLQQQQNLLQPGQTAATQPSGLANIQQNQQASVLRQQQRQQQQGGIIHQQQQPNTMNMQQNNIPDMQQQRLIGQQNMSNLQQQQQQLMMGQQNNLTNMGQQSNVSGLQQQQQQLLGTQSGNSNMQANQHSVHMLQQSKVPVQQTQLTQGQQSQPQSQQQQQILSQIQQRDMQQRLQTSGNMLQQQNVIDHQKQLFQAQRTLPEASSTSLDSTGTGSSNAGDWQEELFQKIQNMKDMYLSELSEMYQKITGKLMQHDSLPQQAKADQLEKLKIFRTMLERLISFLNLPKSQIQIGYKDKLASYEKQIVNFLNSNRPRKPLMQGQALPGSHMHSMQQPQSQMNPQMQPLENQLNPQMQSMNVQQTSGPMMQQNNTMTSSQHNSLSPLSGVSNSLQPSSNFDQGQNNTMNSLQQVAGNSLLQNPMSGSQQVNLSSLSSQSGMNTLNPGMLQHQLVKQENIMPNQQMNQKQYQHRQQFLHKQQLLQQQQQQQQQQFQQAKQQQQSNQMPQLHQLTDARQQLGAKPGAFQQHHSASQRSAFHHQQLKSGAQFPNSSPQLHQSASPQMSQHQSPQIDQQNLLNSLTKANSPFIVPSPSTPLAPSPMPGESEKVNSGVSSLSNAGNTGHQQMTSALVPGQSLAIGTPGISASPLLAEFTGPDNNHGNAATAVSGKSSVSEQPIERLLKAVKSMSPQALSASVKDIGSVVSMMDRIAGSAPGNGSRAAVGEDLVAMTMCRLQARNVIAQDGTTGTRKIKRYTSAMPLNVVSSVGSVNDSFNQLAGMETSDVESTATSINKKPKHEVNQALLEEIREINQRLIDTVVDIVDEDADSSATIEGGEGTIVKCSYTAVALSPNLKSQYASAQMSPIQPLRLLVPANYPICSPILLDKFPVEVSKEHEDLSTKAKSRFSISLRCLSQPMSLKEIAKTWDVCARAVISEYAQQSGGGSFSSKYGTWENCLST